MLAGLLLGFVVDKEEVDVGLAVDAFAGLAIPHYLNITTTVSIISIYKHRQGRRS